MRPVHFVPTNYASEESVVTSIFASEIMDLSTTAPTLNSDQQSDDFNSTLLYNITELTWLNVSNNTQPSITLNTTNTVYQVLLNSVSKKKN